jgi:hypothetical protein
MEARICGALLVNRAENDIQQGGVDLDAAVVVNEARLPKLVHKKSRASA